MPLVKEEIDAGLALVREFKLVSAETPLAAAAHEFNERFPGRLATRYGRHNLDGVSIDDVYIYPPEPCPAPT
jgi:hypothetical protein